MSLTIRDLFCLQSITDDVINIWWHHRWGNEKKIDIIIWWRHIWRVVQLVSMATIRKSRDIIGICTYLLVVDDVCVVAEMTSAVKETDDVTSSSTNERQNALTGATCLSRFILICLLFKLFSAQGFFPYFVQVLPTARSSHDGDDDVIDIFNFQFEEAINQTDYEVIGCHDNKSLIWWRHKRRENFRHSYIDSISCAMTSL